MCCCFSVFVYACAGIDAGCRVEGGEHALKRGVVDRCAMLARGRGGRILFLDCFLKWL